jgi:hypothetical protein
MLLENKGYRLVKQKSMTGAESYALVHNVQTVESGEIKFCVIYVCVEEIATGKKCRLATVVEENADWVVISQPVSDGKHTRVMMWDWDSNDPGYTIPDLKRLCLAICEILPHDEGQLMRWFREITGVQFHVAVTMPQLRMPIAKTTKNLNAGLGAAGFTDLLEEWVNKYLIPTWGQRATPRFVFETPEYEIIEREAANGKKYKVLVYGSRLMIRVREKSTGREITLYKSFAGTSGKERGAWFVTGGVARSAIDPDKVWIIKSNTKSTPYGCMGRSDLCRLATEMNKILPQSDADTDAWLRVFIGKTYDDIIWDRKYEPKEYKYKGRIETDDDREAVKKIFKDRYLTPVWGPRDC